MKNDTSFVFVAHLGPEILHFMFSRWRTAAILDLVVKEEPKCKNNISSVFVMPELIENDTSFSFLAHLVLEM